MKYDRKQKIEKKTIKIKNVNQFKKSNIFLLKLMNFKISPP